MYIRCTPFTPVPSTSRNIARSAVWNHVGKVTEYALLYASSVIIARSLGVEENGRYAGVLSVVQLLLVFGSFGIETTLNTHLPRLTGPEIQLQSRYIVHRAVALRFVLIALLVLPVGLVVMLIGQAKMSIIEFAWVMLGLAVVRGLASVLAAVLTAHLRTAITSTVNVVARSMELLALLALAPAGLSVIAVLLVMICGAAVQIGGYLVCARGEWFGDAQRVAVKPLIVFGGIFWINTLVDYFLGRQGDIFLLTLLLPTSQPASLYDVAYSVMQAVTMVMTIGLSGVSLAVFARMAVSTPELMGDLYEFLVRCLSLVTIPLLVFILFFAEEILTTIYSPHYVPAAVVLQILLGLRVLSRLVGWGENADFLLARGQAKPLVIIGIVAAVSTIVFHVILIPRYGAVGAACGSGAGALIANILAFGRVRSSAPVSMQLRTWSALVVASLGAVCVARFVPLPVVGLWLLAGRSGVFVLALFGALVMLKPLRHRDVARLHQAFGRVSNTIRLFAQAESKGAA